MRPNQLVSLWDFMSLLDNGAIFSGFKLAASLNSKWNCERAGMQSFYGHAFEIVLTTFKKMTFALTEANMPLSANHATEIVAALNKTTRQANGDRVAENESISLLMHHFDRLIGVLPEEANIRIFVGVPPDLVFLYDPKEPLFGDDVERVFPVAIDDIREAGRCLAIGQATAAVFHLMRVMEAGLKGIANELDVPYAPSWESYISQLGALLDGKKYKTLSAEQNKKRPFYQDVLGDLSAIKMAWRNPTMHIVKSYEADQAKSIYLAVESFMKHLATTLEPQPLTAISSGSIAP